MATSSAEIVEPGERDDLIERALRVAHAAVAGPRNRHHRGIVYGDPLGGGDRGDLVGDLLDADRLELEDLRARLDGRRDLVDLRRRHHEDDVRRRLLDGLQQRVEGLLRQPVDFVDDEDLVAVAGRRHAEAVDDDVADLVDAGVGGRVDLEDVHVASFGDLDARVAGAARIGGRSLFAVEAARQDARGRRLADAARAGEHERLRDPVGADRVPERLRHGALADHVLKALRTPFPRENLVGHGRCLAVVMLAQGAADGGRAPPRPGVACGTFQGLLSAAAFRP